MNLNLMVSESSRSLATNPAAPGPVEAELWLPNRWQLLQAHSVHMSLHVLVELRAVVSLHPGGR